MNRAAVVTRTGELHGRTHVRRAVARYRDASRLLDTPGSRRSRGGLDWANFFIAGVQTGFGTFVAFYSANLGWTGAKVGLVLAVEGFAGVLALVPGGATADAVSGKRGLAALGVLMICAAAMILALAPTTVFVFAAEVLLGLTAAIIAPSLSGFDAEGHLVGFYPASV
jgi:predicted MFS family arabinose efflux permease